MLNVLYIDDEKELGEIFKELYSSNNVAIHFYESVKDAIAFAQNNKIDLAFLDYRLPEILGDQVALKLPSEIPKYLITGELEVSLCYQFKEVISKPAEISKVQSIIDSYLKS